MTSSKNAVSCFPDAGNPFCPVLNFSISDFQENAQNLRKSEIEKFKTRQIKRVSGIYDTQKYVFWTHHARNSL